MGIISLLIIGVAAGFIATRAMKMDLPLLPTIALGVLGALLGGLILRFTAAAFGALSGFVGAVLGALLLIWIYDRFIKSR